jgi:ubiquinone/menaquinone biosynthesis C-methylase UbiE
MRTASDNSVRPMPVEIALTSVQRAFSKQADHYDADDFANPILADWRLKVYHHLNYFMKSGSRVLELNAGTGIDAMHLVEAGHTVHATDVSPGMIQKISEKIQQSGRKERFTVQQCSFESLAAIQQEPFDYVFSNFGGLNCCKDLHVVTRQLPGLLKPGGYLTWVIMPPICPWEWLQILKGNGNAFRRLRKEGVMAHLEGEHFLTYYHSLSDIQKSLGSRYQLMNKEGLGALSPPPSSMRFTLEHPMISGALKKMDRLACKHFPFNRWADHIIITFQFT